MSQVGEGSPCKSSGYGFVELCNELFQASYWGVQRSRESDSQLLVERQRSEERGSLDRLGPTSETKTVRWLGLQRFSRFQFGFSCQVRMAYDSKSLVYSGNGIEG